MVVNLCLLADKMRRHQQVPQLGGIGIDNHDIRLEISRPQGGGNDADVFVSRESGESQEPLKLGVVRLIHQSIGDESGEAPVILLQHGYRLFLAAGHGEGLALGDMDTPVFLRPDGPLRDICLLLKHFHGDGRSP